MDKLTLQDVGCWLDSHRGIYIGERIQSIAGAYGWVGEVVGITDRFYGEATDEAEEWLNNYKAPEGCYFGTNEKGDWGLWVNEE